MIIDQNNSCLVIVDVQTKLAEKIFNKNKVINNINLLVKIFKVLNLPIILTEQYPNGLGPTVPEIEDNLKGIDIERIEKTSFSCLGSDLFRKILKKNKKNQIILTGIETHICILQTSFDLIKEEYDVFLIDEATGSRNIDHRSISIERMKNLGVIFTNIEMLIFELLKDSTNPHFKELSGLIK
ncbi:MAG: hydrolase [Rickettsiales bacterium]|nr:hydrolase [Rickettsiales bacterium]|tara:strand:- start:246 stop:794 length:549 start_codon:yes stop_codon:yes gene_type:complete